jgi:hypothetical protein
LEPPLIPCIRSVTQVLPHTETIKRGLAVVTLGAALSKFILLQVIFSVPRPWPFNV